MTRMGIKNKVGSSASHFEKFFPGLIELRIIESIKGRGGGYRLEKNLNQITFSDILNVVEKNIKDAKEGFYVKEGLRELVGSLTLYDLYRTARTYKPREDMRHVRT